MYLIWESCCAHKKVRRDLGHLEITGKKMTFLFIFFFFFGFPVVALLLWNPNWNSTLNTTTYWKATHKPLPATDTLVWNGIKYEQRPLLCELQQHHRWHEATGVWDSVGCDWHWTNGSRRFSVWEAMLISETVAIVHDLFWVSKKSLCMYSNV